MFTCKNTYGCGTESSRIDSLTGDNRSHSISHYNAPLKNTRLEHELNIPTKCTLLLNNSTANGKPKTIPQRIEVTEFGSKIYIRSAVSSLRGFLKLFSVFVDH